MNPYTYNRRGKSAPPHDRGFLSILASAKINSLIAFAIILLAAVSTVAITPLALYELNEGQPYALGVPYHIHLPKIGGKILGDSTTAAAPVKIFYASNLKLAVQPYQYDPTSGNWNYQVLWNRPAGRSGSIYINGNPFVAEATGTGSSFTGFTLSPKTYYRIVFYSQANGQGVRVANRYFATLAAPASTTTTGSGPATGSSGIAPDVEDTASGTPVSSIPHASGTLINDHGTIYLMLPNGKLGIPDVATFNSWNYSFTDAVAANSADENLPVLGVIVPRQPDDNGQTPAASSTLPNSGWKVLISIPHQTVPVSAPVRAAAATDPRQNVTFTFNWGDGNSQIATSTGPYYMGSHSYATAGQYTFTATAVDSAGNTESSTGSINVGTSTLPSALPMLPPVSAGEGQNMNNLPPPPFPMFGSYASSTASTTAGQLSNLDVSLYVPTGGAIGDPITAGAGVNPRPQGVTYTFNWGDGSNSVAQGGSYVATHSYSTAGTYTISVNVSYNNATLGTASKTITITQVGTPAPSIDH